MTPEQIEKLRLEADAYAQKEAPFCHPLSMRFAQIRDTEFARLVSQDTWERAAAICDDMVKRSHSNAAVLIAAAENIRAAAAQEAKS